MSDLTLLFKVEVIMYQKQYFQCSLSISYVLYFLLFLLLDFLLEIIILFQVPANFSFQPKREMQNVKQSPAITFAVMVIYFIDFNCLSLVYQFFLQEVQNQPISSFVFDYFRLIEVRRYFDQFQTRIFNLRRENSSINLYFVHLKISQ